MCQAHIYTGISLKMKNYDLKYIAFHVLVGLYFIWLLVFFVLIGMSLNHTFNVGNLQLAKVYLVWISLNLIMGTSIFMVLRLYRNSTLLGKVIKFSYWFVVFAALVTAILIMIAL